MFERSVKNQLSKIRLKEERRNRRAVREGYKRVKARRKESDSLPVAGRANNIRKQMNYNNRHNIGI